MTHTAIGETLYRIHLYAKNSGAIPPSLAVLPIRSTHINRTTDGWDRPLKYEVSRDGVVSLTSLGRDGAPGGTGADEDIVVRVKAKDEKGKVIAVDDSWAGEALMQEAK